MWILRGEQFQRWLPSVLSMVAFRLTCLLPCRTSVSDPSSSSRSSLRRSMDCWWRRTGVLDLETLAKRWEKLRNEKTDDQAVLTFKTKQKKNTMIFSRLEACETEDARTFSSRPISKFRRLPRTCRMWTWRVDHQSFYTPTNLPTGMFSSSSSSSFGTSRSRLRGHWLILGKGLWYSTGDIPGLANTFHGDWTMCRMRSSHAHRSRG